MAALTTATPSAAPARGAAAAPLALPALPRHVAAAIVFGAWTVVGVFGLFEEMLRGYVGHEARPLHAAALFQCCWQWALFTPIIFRISERFPIERRRALVTLPLHVAFLLAFATVDVTVDRALAPLVDPSVTRGLATRFSNELFINVLNYSAVLAVGHALRFYRESNQRTLEAARLQGELLQARLTALEMRLRPHFLYNTLHSIAALVRVQRGPEAIAMIAGLGDLLRDVLDGDGTPLVPLRREIAFAERYLAIEEVRFGDRMRVRVDVEPGVEGALVPTLLLQPIVENAVRHGIEADPAASLVAIDARRDGGALVVRVRDDGRGASGHPDRDGIGLGTTRERLRAMFGDDCSVSLGSGEGGEVTTTLRLPFRLAGTSGAA